LELAIFWEFSFIIIKQMDKGEVPSNANQGCPGVLSESAGKKS